MHRSENRRRDRIQKALNKAENGNGDRENRSPVNTEGEKKMIFARFQNPKLPKTVFVDKQFTTLKAFRKFEKAAAKHGTKCIEYFDSNSNEFRKGV